MCDFTDAFLSSGSYEHFDVHIKQAVRQTLQRRRSRMLKTVSMMEKKYKKSIRAGKRNLIESWDKKMKKVRRLKAMSHNSYMMGLKVRCMKGHQLLMRVWKGALKPDFPQGS